MNNHAHPKPPGRLAPQLVKVKAIRDVTPGMRCITFTGEQLQSYPAHCEGQHLKIFLPQKHQTQPTLPIPSPEGLLWPQDNERPIVRTYTVRAYRPDLQEIDIEFAIHEHSAPAIDFARKAKPGDWIGISQPGAASPIFSSAHWVFMVGDPSSLPAIAALVEKLPAETQGKIIIRVDDTSHQQVFNKPVGIDVTWLCGDIALTETLIQTVKSWSLPQESLAFWLGGEDSIIRELRRYLRNEKGYPRQIIYAVPYWRHGYSEENYHTLRHQVMDNDD